MKTRISFVSNSSSCSYLIGVKNPSPLLDEIFERDPGRLEDYLYDNIRARNEKIEKATKEGYELFFVEISYDAAEDKIAKFIDKVRNGKIEGVILVEDFD